MSAWTAALLGVVAGVALQLQQAELWSAGVYVAFLLAAGVAAGFASKCESHNWRVLLWALAFACASGGLTGWRAVAYWQDALPHELEGQDLNLVGQVSGLPRVGSRGVQFEFLVESAQLKGQAVRVPSTVQLGWNQPFGGTGAVEAGEGLPDRAALPQVKAGQRWQLTARLKRPHGLFNPQGFDLELWMWEQGLQASGNVRIGRKQPAPVLLAGTGWAPVAAVRQSVRDAIFQRVSDARAAGVLAALVVGDQASIDAADWQIFRVTGVAHAVAISGLHITMFAVMAVWAVGWVWRLCALRWPALLFFVPATTAAAVGGMLLAAAYAVVAGWGVPSQRTVVMLAVVTVLRLSGRRWPWPVLWLSAMAAVLLLDPWALLQAGFWLSFVAVGVLFASSGPDVLVARGLKQHVATMARTQIIVTVALTPLTLLLFGQVSLIGLVANLLAIPWVTWLVTPSTMLGVLFAPLWSIGAWAVQGMTWVLEWLAAAPWAVLERPALPLLLGVLAMAGAMLLVLRLHWSWRMWGLLLAWPALTYVPPRPDLGRFEVLAPDVGQGGAILVRTKHHTLLHDAGPQQGSSGGAAQRVLLPLLRAQGERLQGVVISHSDSDHAGGLPVIAAKFPRAELWASFDTQSVAGRPATRCEVGQQWVWDEVTFTVLHPHSVDYEQAQEDNALSCVLKITAADGTVALLTGDISVKEEARLVQLYPALKVDLLVAPHHGSKTSSSALWLDAWRPRQIVIQSGYRNRYGHPSPQVLARYDERGIPWFNSPDCGAARWRSADPQAVECQRQTQRRYWHDSASGLTGVKQIAAVN